MSNIEEVLQNTLLDYIEQGKINREHQRENGELREKVKALEKEKSEWEKAYQEEKDSQFELLKRIQELEAKLEFKEFGDLDNIQFEEYMSQFIPKQKAINKIKELKNDIKNGNTRYPYIEEHKIEVLQELLEGEK